MEKEKILSKMISISPNYLDKNLIKTLIYIIKSKYEKTCNEEDGLILSVTSIENIKNVISKDSKEIHFFISFKALTIKPHKDMKLSFKPSLIINKGIFGKLYDVFSVFIPESNIKDWNYDKESFKHKIDEYTITKDKEVNVVITDIKFSGTKYNCICSLDL